MSIQKISNTTAMPFTSVSNKKNDENNSSELRLKAATAATTALGVTTALALIAKKQGFALSPSRIAKTPIKDWAIFKIPNKNKPNGNVLKLETFEILGIGLGSVLGGLAGGALFDKKENLSSKCSEAVSQFFGDIAVPLSFVALPTLAYKSFEELAQKETKHLKLQNLSKFIQGNKVLKILCPTLISGSSLVAGIIAGNKVCNKFNEHVNGVKQERGIRLTDFAPHLDDVCLAITLMASESPIGSIISKLVPLALTIAGYETGTANPKNRVG